MRNRWMPFLLAGLVIGCAGEKENVKSPEEAHKKAQALPEVSPSNETYGTGVKNYGREEFKDFYRDFFIAIIESDAGKFNQYIHPQYGLYIIHAKGAMPEITHVSDILQFKRNDNRSIFAIDKSKVGYELIKEELPEINCDLPGFYSKEGSFTQDTNLLVQSGILQHVEFSKKSEEVALLAESISKTVVNTSNYTYYFSFINGNWYLTFLDVRHPCEA